jgi:hypothetical protein
MVDFYSHSLPFLASEQRGSAFIDDIWPKGIKHDASLNKHEKILLYTAIAHVVTSPARFPACM